MIPMDTTIGVVRELSLCRGAGIIIKVRELAWCCRARWRSRSELFGSVCISGAVRSVHILLVIARPETRK